MTKFLLCCCVAVLLAACGTSVPLSDVPVADGTVKSVGGDAPGVGGAGAPVTGNSVAQVDVGNRVEQVAAPSAPNVVYFDYDSFVIKPEYQSVITVQARLIKSRPVQKIAIEGHTDERGGREYNLALGQRRAEAVVGALTILGVSQNQMEAVSFGKEKPVAVGADEVSYAKNRRAEIRVY
jgi:peptidoglycan-associated lipoprotein